MDLMTRIDTPLFQDVTIRYFYPVVFSNSQAAPLFSRTTNVQSILLSTCGPLQLYSCHVRAILPFPSTGITLWNILVGKISRSGSERQVANLRQRRKLLFRLRCRFVPRPVSPFHLMLLSYLQGSISVIKSAMRSS